ncbi:MAG: DUF502 domain-containing protein [Flavobacteriales bacterium]
MMMRNIPGRIIKYFFQGVLIIVPLVITVYVIVKLFFFIDNIIPTETPGLGILILLGSITLIGVLGNTFIAQPIRIYISHLMKKAPLINTIYKSVKDLLSAFVGNKKRFTEPVLVKVNKNSDLEKLGFITRKDLTELGISKGKVAVYLPHSYAFSGNMFIVPKENVTPVDAPASDIMTFIVSAGVVDVDQETEIT